MRLYKKFFESDGSGEASVEPEETEDLWNLYNLISINDRVTALAFRKVQRTNAVGSVSTDTHRTTVTFKVTSSDFDGTAGTLRISGRTCETNEYIQLGSYHTVTVKPSMHLTLRKEHWDFMAREKLSEALEPRQTSEVAVVLIDMGVCNMYLLTRSLVKDLCSIQTAVPKKRSAGSGYEKAKEKFFEQVLISLANRIDYTLIQCIVLAGPGFAQTDFYQWMLASADRFGFPHLIIHKGKFVVCKASSAYRHSVHELLSDKTIMEKVADIKAIEHATALEALYKGLHSGSHTACYGIAHVDFASSRGAIKTLLVTDYLFRSSDCVTRKQYARLAEAVKKAGGEVLAFSDMHVSGQQLQQITGIAALLKFPLPELEHVPVDYKSYILQEQ